MDAAVPEIKDSEEIVANKNSTRYKRRYMKRQWEDPEDGSSDAKKVCDTDKPTERIKRKKMAMLLGYCGVDYYGMQRNPGVKTIEEDLLKALLDAKYITDEDFKNQQNTQFQRSSRTDKNVSAARQVVSLKLPLEINVDEINKNLPDTIRVFGVKRVTNKFNSKVKCNARSYSYVLPTYVFEPSLTSPEERKQYRITAEKLEQVNKILDVYKGTKGYHNFTEKKHYQDPSASRYMMGFKIHKIFVESDMEFASLLVKGQSFMLHQIRKMVGLMIAVKRGLADMSIMDKVFGKDKVMLPTAPGLGLVLEMVHYDRYDTKFKSSHESLTWAAEEEAVEKFKKEFIYPTIIKGEVEEYSIGTWIDTKLVQHKYEPVEEVPGDNPVEDFKDSSQQSVVADSDDDDDTNDEDKLEICEGKDSIEDISSESTTPSDITSKANIDSPNVDSTSELSIIDIPSEDSSSTNMEIMSAENSNLEDPNVAAKDETNEENVEESAEDSSEAFPSDNVSPNGQSPKRDDKNGQSAEIDDQNALSAEVDGQNAQSTNTDGQNGESANVHNSQN